MQMLRKLSFAYAGISFPSSHNLLHLPYVYKLVGKQVDFIIALWATTMYFSVLVPF